MSSVLQVHNLKRVVDQRVILTGLNFTVQSPGDVLFIRGASGVGKSLLLRVLACLDPLEACRTFLANEHAPVVLCLSPRLITGRRAYHRRAVASADWSTELARTCDLRPSIQGSAEGHTI